MRFIDSPLREATMEREIALEELDRSTTSPEQIEITENYWDVKCKFLEVLP